MAYGNTRQVRKVLNEAVKDAGAVKGSTWTDAPGQFGRRANSTTERIVTYAVTDVDKVAALAQKMLRAAGYDNDVRVTDNDIHGGGPYIKVNAELAYTS